jgi:hypothetical protein
VTRQYDSEADERVHLLGDSKYENIAMGTKQVKLLLCGPKKCLKDSIGIAAIFSDESCVFFLLLLDPLLELNKHWRPGL